MSANILSIAGLDPSGGAGVIADAKTISACGGYAMAVVTAITAQNTHRVTKTAAISPDLVAAQIDAIFADIRVDAIKIGMLGTGGVACAVAERLARRSEIPVVLDPVLAASSGDSLADSGALAAIRERLIPIATVVTPNLEEAARLVDLERISSVQEMNEREMDEAAARMFQLGAKAVLIKGGHSSGPQATDTLYLPGERLYVSAPRLNSTHTHGTGCALSSAIACGLARGLVLFEAVRAAKAYVSGAIAESSQLEVGSGHGPIHHFWSMKAKT